MTDLRDRRKARAKADMGEADFSWRDVAYHVQVSREMDRIEEEELVPGGKLRYQFSARGHDMAQVILGLQLTHRHDAACGYYRSRPLLLTLGVDPADALGSGMARAGGYSDGRDIGAVFNYPNPNGAPALPMCGGVGAQYTPTAGWAQAITYYQGVLGDASYAGAIALVLGGDASCATNGFWSALTIATTQKLPMLFYVEDNQFGISVPSRFQTPGGDIAKNLESFTGLHVLSGDGTEPEEAARLIGEAFAHVRGGKGPALLRLTVPRLQGHSFQDTQAYKDVEFVKSEWARDPLPKLRAFVGDEVWEKAGEKAKAAVAEALAEADARPVAEPETVTSHVFYDGEMQLQGGQWTKGSGSTWSPRSARCSTTSWSSTRACCCSARISGPRAASMR
jgi:2-oxoisovalerate dehydrogenase E1 component